MAKWSWTFSKQARKDFQALDKKLQKKILHSLDLLAQQSPSCDVGKLKGEDNIWRLKLGNWRVIFTKEHEVFRILVIEIVRRTTTTY